MVAVLTFSADAAAVTMFVTSAGASGANDAPPSEQTAVRGQVAVGSGAIACRRGAPNAENARRRTNRIRGHEGARVRGAFRRTRAPASPRTREPSSDLIHERRCVIGKNNRFSALELMFRDPLAAGGAHEERAVGRVLIDDPHLSVARPAAQL